MSPKLGDVICGRIRLLDRLNASMGSPVFGEVWIARDDESGEKLWLTIVDEQFLPSAMGVSAFMASANGLPFLRHPSLVRVTVVDREEHYCVLGFESLNEASPVSFAASSGPSKISQIRQVANELARGLAFLHDQDCVHGMLTAKCVVSWQGSALIWQYGIAPFCNPDAVAERCKKISGCAVFAPEISRGDPITPQTDVFGWAATIAEMAYDGDAIGGVAAILDKMPDSPVDRELHELLRQCLQTRPNNRPFDGRSLLDSLESIQSVMTSAPSLNPRSKSFEHENSRLIRLESHRSDSNRSGLDEAEWIEADEIEAIQPEMPSPSIRSKTSDDSRLFRLHDLVVHQVGSQAAVDVHQVLAPGEDREQSDVLESWPEPSKSVPRIDPIATTLYLATPDKVIEAVDEAKQAQEKPLSPAGFKLPRRPGPHGPSAGIMSFVVLGVAAVLGVFSIWHVTDMHGGLGHVFKGSIVESSPAPPLPDSLPPIAGVNGVTDTLRGKPKNPNNTDASEQSANKASNPASPIRLNQATQVPSPSVAAPPQSEQRCPPGTVAIGSDYCIDIAEYPGLGRYPMVNVSLGQASALCRSRKARLCSRVEWKKVCESGDSRRVPYGGQANPERCNTGSAAGFARELMQSGEMASCATPLGVYDLVGNAGEWVAGGEVVGGDSTTPFKKATCQAGGRPPIGYSDRYVGFRCCWGR